MSEEKKYQTAAYNVAEVRRQASAAQQRPSKARRKKMRRKRTALYLACVLIVSCLLAAIGWLLCNDLCALNKPYEEISMTVNEGDNVSDIARNLKRAGLIEYKFLFKMVAPVFHAKGFIDPGTYDLNTEMDYRSLIWNMHDYETDRLEAAGLVQVTIPEGLSVSETIDLLVENGISNRAALEDAAANYEFEDYTFLDPELLGNINRMEGFLFPDTYQFFKEKSAVLVFDTMLLNFQNQISQEMLSAIEYSQYSLGDVIKVASLIEKETDGTDRGKIASVIYNRLENDGETAHLLQIDASLKYVLGREVTPEDYETLDSEYNLYLHKGLPPTAIASPGMESIKAAIYPDDTDYYFYVLGKDGKHIFSCTLAEHNAAMAGLG